MSERPIYLVKYIYDVVSYIMKMHVKERIYKNEEKIFMSML